MSANDFIIITKDQTKISVDRALFIAKSGFIREALLKDKDTREVELPMISATHLKLIIKYYEHHAKKEVPAPVDSVKTTYTFDNMFEDKWDGKYLLGGVLQFGVTYPF